MSNGSKAWTSAEDEILIDGFARNMPWPDLLALLPGRKKDSTTSRAVKLRMLGVDVPFRPQPKPKSEANIDKQLAQSKKEDEAREAAKAVAMCGWPAYGTLIDGAFYGTRLFEIDPAAIRDHGSSLRIGNPSPLRSPYSCSAAWAVGGATS